MENLKRDRRLMDDLKYVAEIYGWEKEDKVEAWEALKKDLRWKLYWHDLAEFHRTGKPLPIRY